MKIEHARMTLPCSWWWLWWWRWCDMRLFWLS